MPDASLHRELLGATVRDLRRNRGLTLRDLARALAVSPATLSAIENGRTGTSSERVVQLADALGVRVERLVGNLAEPVSDERWALRASAGARAPGPAGDWRTYAPLVLDPALRGALATFLELGYHGATMRAVAARSGLSVAGLYHYYASKQQMLVTILDRTMSDLAARTDAAAAAGADPAERFANLVECLALFHTHRRELGFIGAAEMRSLLPAARHRIAAVRRGEQAKVDREVVAGRAAGAFDVAEPLEAARAVVTMCTALAQWYRPTGPATPEEVAAGYVELALDAVRCRPSARPLPRR
ncbi:AcrR family transcriptional regulator [Nocardioides zeae]|uniref:AcrR family transcriptional regulator n=1 Tax=Nocardioides zeae TaxID=1457234 RepID=A0ACC6IK26_9ACTN|nr:helix-turn-helix domain-containing protein [Nocardioides zeae]MDR6173567.1 AcrR family transcriptional regulator [Nocardioides zeae]MDR6210972.1 AcrR family transcriptional regulator [Nocardioides zeae]